MTNTGSFTVEDIKAAHAKVKSGADFPAYIQDIKQLGVTSYETYVTDGHTRYWGNSGHTANSGPKHAPLLIAGITDAKTFEIELKAHQQGKTDYLTFCNACAKTGIEKWAVAIDNMTCTYYDKMGNPVLEEQIPS